MTDKYKEEVEGLIKTNGAMGVNALSKAMDIPLSTIQKYMHRQSYFRMNVQRKWDLPVNVATPETKGPISNFDTVIDSQLTGITSLYEMLLTQIKMTITILGAQKPAFAPVASSSDDKSDIMSQMDSRMITMSQGAHKLRGMFKAQKSTIPEQYYDLLMNYDHIGLIIKEGGEYATKFLEDDVYPIASGSVDELDEETVQILKDNQIKD